MYTRKPAKVVDYIKRPDESRIASREERIRTQFDPRVLLRDTGQPNHQGKR